MGHFCFLQFDDWVWDDLEESSDHIVPEPDDDNEQTAWPSVDDSRRMFQWEQPLSLVKNPGLISQSSWGSSGGEYAAMKEGMKGEQTVLGSGDLPAYMMDSMYSEEGASIGTPTCRNVLGNVDFDESELPLFAEDGDKVDEAGDKNSVNWDEVDILLRCCFTLTNSSFAQVLRYNSGELQWPGSSHSSDLQSTISMPPVRSSVESDGKLEEFNMKMDFISMDSPISLPSSTTLPELGFKKQSYGAVNSGKLEPGEQLQPLRQSISPVDKNAPLQEAKVHSAHRHAVNHKRSEQKSKRHSKRQKFVQGMPHVSFREPQQLRPMAYQLLLPRDPSSNSHLGYASDLQRPIMPYMPAAYAPSMHLLPALPPNILHAQMQQQQGLYTHYHEPCLQQGELQLPNHLQPQPDMAVPCPSSSSSMTPQEKLEKLRWRQQVQAQLAVEQQQQQLALQGLTTVDETVLSQTPEGSGIMPVSPLKQSAISLSVKSSSEINPEPSLSVGQASTRPLLGEDDRKEEAEMLLQLENTIKQLEDRTRLFIRDALYRLARSARQRQATGGSSNQASEEDSECDLEPSTSGGNPSSSAQASRLVKMNRVETQTNPIDRSIAHLLFHQRMPQQAKLGPHFSPAATNTLSSHRTSNGPQIWPSEALPPGKSTLDVDKGVAAFPGMNVLQHSTMSNEGLDSTFGGRLLDSVSTPEQPDTVALNKHASSLPFLSTENLSPERLQNFEAGGMVVAGEGPSATSSQGADTSSLGPEAMVPRSNLRTGQEDIESQPKRLQRAAGLSELSMYIEEVASLEPAVTTDENFVGLSCPSHSIHSTQAVSQGGSILMQRSM
ncbi:unnamed protein product [Sphagnum jensenii]|uniref:Uncharacterized protein n=1 Tax=Sphagnum jensenii TaxID=128206 RepID=A0ABP1AXD6_9BRYO